VAHVKSLVEVQYEVIFGLFLDIIVSILERPVTIALDVQLMYSFGLNEFFETLEIIIKVFESARFKERGISAYFFYLALFHLTT